MLARVSPWGEALAFYREPFFGVAKFVKLVCFPLRKILLNSRIY